MNELLLRVLLPMSLAGGLFVAMLQLAAPLRNRLGGGKWRTALIGAALLFVLPLLLLFFHSGGGQPAAGQLVAETLRTAAPTQPVYRLGEATADVFSSTASTGSAAEAPSAFVFPVAQALSLFYGLGFAGFASLYGIRYLLFLYVLRKSCRPVAGSEEQTLLQLCRGLGIRRPPQLVESDRAAVSMLVGIFCPRIILPATPMDSTTLAFALRHELVHYRQKDLPFKMLMLFASAMHWFNPLVHLLRHSFADACEQRCDEQVVADMGSEERSLYARTLLQFAGRPLPYAASGLAAPVKKLKRRLICLIHPAKPTKTARIAGATTICLLLAAGLLAGCGFAAGAAGSGSTDSILSAPPSGTADPAAGASLSVDEDLPVPAGDSSVPAESSGTSSSGENDFLWPVPEWTGSSRGFMSEAHRGLDIEASTGASIVAVAAGTVTEADFHYSWGNYLLIDHGGGLFTRYAHCETLFVAVGEQVTAGEAIATVGSTGYSSGPQLHIEFVKDGRLADPMDYLTRPE